MWKAIAGLVVGAVVGALVGARLSEGGMEVAALSGLHTEQADAREQYLHGDPGVAIYAMEHLIRQLKATRDSAPMLRTALGRDLAVAYTRLGVLAEKGGDHGKATQAFSDAMLAFAVDGPRVESVDEAKAFVQRVDQIKPRR